VERAAAAGADVDDEDAKYMYGDNNNAAG